MNENPPERVFCNECENHTLHNTITSHTREFNENIGDSIVTSYETVEILECRGCESIKTRRTLERTGSNEKIAEYYPPDLWRRPPSWLNKAPDNIKALFMEIYSAMCMGWNRLAALGSRALIDDIILESVGDVGTFQAKLNALKDDDYISGRDVDLLKAALEPGHAAMHRGAIPSNEVLDMVIDILENLVRKMFVINKYAAMIYADIPGRDK